MLHQKTVIERLLAGEIQPSDIGGILAWMGLTPEVMGDDAHNYAWAEEYREAATAAGAEEGPHA
jgi:toluene monooxygenase system protein A